MYCIRKDKSAMPNALSALSKVLFALAKGMQLLLKECNIPPFFSCFYSCFVQYLKIKIVQNLLKKNTSLFFMKSHYECLVFFKVLGQNHFAQKIKNNTIHLNQ